MDALRASINRQRTMGGPWDRPWIQLLRLESIGESKDLPLGGSMDAYMEPKRSGYGHSPPHNYLAKIAMIFLIIYFP
jgi:hypothetical protein